MVRLVAPRQERWVPRLRVLVERAALKPLPFQIRVKRRGGHGGQLMLSEQ